MGCGISQQVKIERSQLVANNSFSPSVKILNKRCPTVRLDVSNSVTSSCIEGKSCSFSIDYIYASQRGYYPSDLDKPNQDSYLITQNILCNPNSHIFGIFDGNIYFFYIYINY